MFLGNFSLFILLFISSVCVFFFSVYGCIAHSILLKYLCAIKRQESSAEYCPAMQCQVLSCFFVLFCSFSFIICFTVQWNWAFPKYVRTHHNANSDTKPNQTKNEKFPHIHELRRFKPISWPMSKLQTKKQHIFPTTTTTTAIAACCSVALNFSWEDHPCHRKFVEYQLNLCCCVRIPWNVFQR